MFWIKVKVEPAGEVVVSTFYNNGGCPTGNALRERRGATVSQALRALAASMVVAKAETVEGK